MQIDIDEKVPRGGTSLLTVFGLPGALLGFVFWAIVENLIDEPATERLAVALALGLLSGGGTYVLTVLRGEVLRAAFSGALVGSLIAALVFLAQGAQAWQMSDGVLPVLAGGVIVTVTLPFLRAASKHNSFFDYRPLYADAWTIPAIVGIAQVFAAVGGLLALLVAALFEFIGLGFLRELMGEPWFVLPYAGLLQGVGIGVVRQREAAVLAARSVTMALVRVTAPVFAFCAAVFIGAVMIRGFGSLIDGLSPVATLTAAAAAAIVMINAIVADEGRPENALFGATSRLLGVLLLFLMALAGYGLFMRIAAEGWTPNRIVAAVAVGIVALYAPIYAAAALAEKWAILRQGNIVMSAVLVLIAVLVQTPAFRPYDWSVASQLAIIRAAPDEVPVADLRFLRTRLGEPGVAAFEALEEDEALGLADRLAEAERTPFPLYDPEAPGDFLTLLIEDGTLAIVPEGTVPGEDLRALVARSIGGRTPVEAVLVFGDDGDTALLVQSYSYSLHAQLFVRAGDGWQARGFGIAADTSEAAALLAAARRGDFGLQQVTIEVPRLGARTLVPTSDASPFVVSPADAPALPEPPAEAAEGDPQGGDLGGEPDPAN